MTVNVQRHDGKVSPSGWPVIYALLVILTFTSGLSFYNHTVIIDAFAAKQAFNVSSVSFAVTLFFLAAGFGGLAVSKLIEHFDPRISFCLGALLSSAALASLSIVDSIFWLYLVYILFGIGFSASALIPATTLVTQWFTKKRAVALSVASTGLSLGGVIITPASKALVENYGFDTSAIIMGIAYLIGVIPATLIWIKPAPRHDSEFSYDKKQMQSENNIAFKRSVASTKFWGISIAYIFLMMAQVGGIAHQVGLAREQVAEEYIKYILAILPWTSIIGRLIGGWLLDQFSIRVFAIYMMVIQIGSLSLLAFNSNAVTLCLGLAAFGTSVGNLLMLHPLLIADNFDSRAYNKLFSVSNLMSSWGTASGPTVVGLAYTFSGDDYGMAYAAIAAAGVIGLGCFLSVSKQTN